MTIIINLIISPTINIIFMEDIIINVTIDPRGTKVLHQTAQSKLQQSAQLSINFNPLLSTKFEITSDLCQISREYLDNIPDLRPISEMPRMTFMNCLINV